MRLSSKTISITGYPGEASGIGKTALINLGDMALTGIQAIPFGLDEVVTNAVVTNLPQILQPQEQVNLNIDITASSGWFGTIGMDFTTEQVYIWLK